MSYRSAYINALTVGKTGFEIEKMLCPEVDAIWAEVARCGEVTAKGVAHAV